jgi:hypothetical protein
MGGVVSLVIASVMLCCFLMALGLATRKKSDRATVLDQTEAAVERLMDIEEELYGDDPPWKTDSASDELETDELKREEMRRSDEQANANEIRAEASLFDDKPPVSEK